MGVSFIDVNIGWAVGADGTILRTTDGGENWVSQTSGTTEWLSTVHFLNANTGISVGMGGTILKTTNGGETWTPQTSGTTASLQDVCFVNTNTGIVVGEFYDHNIGSTTGVILKTTNSGETWKQQSIDRALFAVQLIDLNIGMAFGDGGTILRTTNGGEIWNYQTSGTDYRLNGVSFTDPNNGTTVGFTPSDRIDWDHGTILRTTNGGITFFEEKKSIEAPSKFLLLQNYPNPFNPSTTIKYQIPELSFVTLKVYDVLGSEVTTLVSEEKLVGSYVVDFDARELSSGIYFYQLNARNFVENKKMLLIK